MKTSKDGWTKHDSSHITHSKYDAMNGTLDIKFHNGSVYRHYGVPPSEHQAFMNAPSQGIYHSNFIKNSYPVEQIA
jgi:hypothetical protein